MKYYIILSTGSYSDYEAQYYCGDIKITQDELDKKAKETTKEMLDLLDSLPLRKVELCQEQHSHEFYCKTNPNETERYFPETGEIAHSFSLFHKWQEKMIQWLKEKGFEKLPEDIPEINTYYFDMPFQEDFRQVLE